VLVALGLTVGGLAAAPAGAAPRETPLHKIARLRAEVARVQRTIDGMNNRIEGLVEDYDANQEALARTRAEQARTEREQAEAQRELLAAERQLGERLWTIYTEGPTTGLSQLLGAVSVHDALTTATYQQRVVGADRAAVDRVTAVKARLADLAAQLAGQRRRQERLQLRLLQQRRQIQSRLAAQRAYLSRVNKAVKQAILEERRRQEELRRRALARRLAAERAARLRAAAARQAAAAANGRPWGAAPGPVGSPSGAARGAVAFALAQLGKPYVWGASGPGAYDCSGLTMAAYRSVGVYLPRVSRAQWYAGPHVAMVDLAPGDLVFFAYNTGSPASIHHVGIYIGRGLMVEAPFTGASVRVSSIGRADYIGAVRPTG
jgi:cell wall-associated NlpC family hydrolase